MENFYINGVPHNEFRLVIGIRELGKLSEKFLVVEGHQYGEELALTAHLMGTVLPGLTLGVTR